MVQRSSVAAGFFVALRKSERLKKNNQTLQVLFGQWVGEHVLMLREEVSQGVGPAIVQQVHPMGNTQQGRGVEASVPLLVFNPCVISCRVRVIRGDMAIGTPGLFEDFFSRLEKHLGGRDLFWWRCLQGLHVGKKGFLFLFRWDFSHGGQDRSMDFIAQLLA